MNDGNNDNSGGGFFVLLVFGMLCWAIYESAEWRGKNVPHYLKIKGPFVVKESREAHPEDRRVRFMDKLLGRK